MALSNDLISQFVKATKDDKKSSNETTMYGTIVYDGKPYVKLDGSDLLTPVSTTANVQDGERVTVLIKNHLAIVTGNISFPSARQAAVDDLTDEIAEFEIIVADKVSTDELVAANGRIDNLVTENATINEKLVAAEAAIKDLEAVDVNVTGKLTAAEGEIENLKTTKLDAKVADITYATIETLEATDAKIHNLEATYGEFENLTTKKFEAVEAEIEDLDVKKLDVSWANIDFANIDQAVIAQLFSESGIIKDLVVENGMVVAGELVGVTIKGDLIEGETIVADKLVVLGEDGLYYKLNVNGETVETEQTDYNSLNGSIITAKSVTAEKINVSDLVAFGATIGGFHITTHSLYSGVKESVDNTTIGVYMDSDAQFAIGDESNYLRFYKDDNDLYRLDISAASLSFSSSSKSIEETIEEIDNKVTETGDNLSSEIEDQKSDMQEFVTKFSKYIRFMEDENGDPSDTAMTIGSGDSVITLEIDNEKGLVFKKNGVEFGWWDGIDFHTGNIVVEVNERAQFGNFAYIPRSDGSLSFLKVGG